LRAPTPTSTRGTGGKSKLPKKTEANHAEIAVPVETWTLRKKHSKKATHPVTEDPQRMVATAEKLVKKTRGHAKKDKAAISPAKARRTKETLAALEHAEQKINKVTGPAELHRGNITGHR